MSPISREQSWNIEEQVMILFKSSKLLIKAFHMQEDEVEKALSKYELWWFELIFFLVVIYTPDSIFRTYSCSSGCGSLPKSGIAHAKF